MKNIKFYVILILLLTMRENVINGQEITSSFESYMESGDACYESEKYEEAIGYYKKATECDDSTGVVIKAYYQLGRAYLYNNETDKALETFKACSLLHGTYMKQISEGIESESRSGAEMLFCILDARLSAARLSRSDEEKIKYYENVLSFHFPMVQAKDYVELAISYGREGDIEKYQQTVRDAYSMFPDDIDVMYSYALQLRIGDPEALPLLTRIIEKEDTVKPVTFNYGSVYSHIASEYTFKEMYDEALPYAEKAVALSPELYYCWMILGKTYFYLGRYEECVDATTKGLACDDCMFDEELLGFRGQAYLKLGETEKGEADLRAAEQTKQELEDRDKQIMAMLSPNGEEGFDNPETQYTIGMSYFEGNLLAQDYAKAVEWFQKAADQGHIGGQYMLGVCYYHGYGVGQNYATAAEWLRKAAEQGYAWAQHDLGECYYQGYGVEQDYSEAAKWYLKAAEQGDALAQNNIGQCYWEGLGVEQDYAEAAKWYKKAAEQGRPIPQWALGMLYYNGQGVEQDYAKAVEWWRKAAAQDFEPAKKCLEDLGESY